MRLTAVEGPNELNDQIYHVTSVVNSYKFKLNADTSKSIPYSRGGIFRKIKKKLGIKFEALRSQLDKPDIVAADLSLSKFSAPYLTHILLHTHLKAAAYSSLDAFLAAVRSTSEKFKLDNPSAPIGDAADFGADLERLARVFYLTRRARLPPLTAFYGGLCAQETLKSITSKFIPFKQWFYLDCSELFEIKDLNNLDIESKF